ncbi:MAG: hypothetical protein U9P90_01425 [Patescibacteria group bacterium]|nr:hypothetical protein [Patescibacteria group bacterium]
MRSFVGLALISGMLVFSSVANAEEREYDWHGPEIDLYFNFSFPIEENSLFLLSLEGFGVCDTGYVVSFARFGVSQRFAEWYTISALIGMAGNMPIDRTSFMIGFSNNFSFASGDFTLLINPNALVAHDVLMYFGVYALDFHWNGVNMGMRAEQVNTGITFGPRVGYTVSVWHFEVQYHMGVQEENYGHTVRFVYGLSF